MPMCPVEIAPGRYLLDPRSFAKALQLAEITADDLVLDVGCGSGYSSAVLARLAKNVVALEQDADLVRLASGLLEREPNIQVTQGALIEGFKGGGLYDVIFVEGAIEAEPATLLTQLEEGGRLVTFEQAGAQGRAVLYIKEHGQVGRRAAFDAFVPLLAGFKKHVGFHLLSCSDSV